MNYTIGEYTQQLGNVTAEQCTNMCRQIVVNGYEYYIIGIVICCAVGIVYTTIKMGYSKEKYFFFFLLMSILVLVLFLVSRLQNIVSGIYYV